MVETILFVGGMITGVLLCWFFILQVKAENQRIYDQNILLERINSKQKKDIDLKDFEMRIKDDEIESLAARIKLSSERELKTAKGLKSAIKSGYQAKASDAKMRAFRNKAPKKLLAQMENWLEGAIGQGMFEDWQNKPTSMKTDKSCK